MMPVLKTLTKCCGHRFLAPRAIIAFYLLVVPLSAQSLSKPLTANEQAVAQGKITPGTIPEYAGDLRLETKQEFAVAGPGGGPLWIVPVKYLGKNAEGAWQRCGLVTLRAAGALGFLETYGSNLFPEMQCGGVTALGFMATAQGTPPRLLLVLLASGPPRLGVPPDTFHDVRVLDWDGGSGRYAPNKGLEDKLGQEKRPTETIAEIKQRIRRYEGGAAKAP